MASGRSASELANELADLLEHAKDMPLLETLVRVDLPDARRLSSELLETSQSTSTLHLAAEKAQEAVMRAKRVPLTDQVRLPREVAKTLAQELRTAARSGT